MLWRCAVLCCAVLCCAMLCCAVLCCAVLCCAVLCCAVLCCAVLCCAVPCRLCHFAVANGNGFDGKWYIVKTAKMVSWSLHLLFEKQCLMCGMPDVWYVHLQFAAGQGRPRAVEGGIAPGAGPPLTSFPIIPVQHENPFIGPIGTLLI